MYHHTARQWSTAESIGLGRLVIAAPPIVALDGVNEPAASPRRPSADALLHWSVLIARWAGERLQGEGPNVFDGRHGNGSTSRLAPVLHAGRPHSCAALVLVFVDRQRAHNLEIERSNHRLVQWQAAVIRPHNIRSSVVQAVRWPQNARSAFGLWRNKAPKNLLVALLQGLHLKLDNFDGRLRSMWVLCCELLGAQHAGGCTRAGGHDSGWHVNRRNVYHHG